MRRLQQTAYAVCMLLAVVVLAAAAILAHPPKPAENYMSTHPASTMAPLMGFPADALVNAGDAEALDALPGVGEVIAGRIIETREMLKGFRLPEDLLLVKGIGQKTLEKIMDALEAPLVPLEELE